MINLKQYFLTLLSLLLLILSGCTGETKNLGILNLQNEKDVKIEGEIRSDSWPSRWVVFSFIGNKSSFTQSVAESSVRVVIENTGTTPFYLETYGTGRWIQQGNKQEVGPVNFLDFRLHITPEANKSASVCFSIFFDKPYTTINEWALISGWSDGP